MSAAPTRQHIDDAFQACLRLARSHYENFSVATRFLPREKRPHVAALYAYCRTVDDLGDEAEGDRLRLLDDWQADLERCYTDTPRHPYLLALQQTIHAFGIPREPLLKLIEANRMDQGHPRYATYDDLLRYCDHSANPVGHLYLALFGYRDAERQRLADATCTALQLANFWQDVRRDYAMGRAYLPQEDLRAFGVSEETLGGGVATDAFRSLMAFEVERARSLFLKGQPLVDLVEGTERLHLTLFTLGGRRVLDAIRDQKYDVLRRRPVVTRSRKAWLLLRTYVSMRLSGALRRTGDRQA